MKSFLVSLLVFIVAFASCALAAPATYFGPQNDGQYVGLGAGCSVVVSGARLFSLASTCSHLQGGQIVDCDGQTRALTDSDRQQIADFEQHVQEWRQKSVSFRSLAYAARPFWRSLVSAGISIQPANGAGRFPYAACSLLSALQQQSDNHQQRQIDDANNTRPICLNQFCQNINKFC